jgi:hypothetical protein
MTIKLSKRLAAKFIREAKKQFPKEFLVYCIGSKGRGGSIVIRDLIFPNEGEIAKATEDEIHPTLGFECRAWTLALEQGWELLGDLHTHCYESNSDGFSDPAPSYQDYDRFHEVRKIAPFQIFGICVLQKYGRKMYSRITFWPAAPPPTVQLV